MPERTRNAIVIEDDRFLSSLIKARLEKMGVTVSQAFDGAAAITAIAKQKPDVIVLDLVMPRMTGFEVLEKISSSADLKNVPVVVLSHLAQESDIEKARQMGATAYFVKVKVSIDDVLAKIAELIQ
ncbi:MAG TPA: response regulator [Candidatus Paceibacterota bacterium]|nr:response regulator [Candidatus Paceibacterota bacterium]